MRSRETDRGFRYIDVNKYIKPEETVSLVQESSAVDFSNKDSLSCPGSSFLWVGNNEIHLNRRQVKKFIDHLQYWIDTGRLPQLCDGCEKHIDPDFCHCGMGREQHGMEGHPFVPIGCDCFRAKKEPHHD